MTSLDQMREMLRSGAFGDAPNPELGSDGAVNPSATSAQEATKKVANKRELEAGSKATHGWTWLKMVRLDMMGEPDSRHGGARFKKLYIITLSESTAGGRWLVNASWGRVGESPKTKSLYEGADKTRATKLYRSKMNSKIDRGYNIESQIGAE